MADAQEMANRPGVAKGLWRAALPEVDKRLQTAPASIALLRWKAYIQQALDDPAAAATLKLAREITTARSTVVMDYDKSGRLFTADELLDELEQRAQDPRITLTLGEMRLNPALDKVREHPRFKALLARMEADGRYGPKPAVTVTAPVSEAKRLARQAHELLLKVRSDVDIETAATLSERALRLDNADAEVWALAAEVDCARLQFQSGRLASSAESINAARVKSQTALRLDGNSFEAKRAAAAYQLWSYQGADGDRSRDLETNLLALRRERTADPMTLLLLGYVYRFSSRTDEAVSVFDELATQPQHRATALNEKAWTLYTGFRLAESDTVVDASIAVEPFNSNVLLKVLYALRWHGDRDLALSVLEKLPASNRQDTAGVVLALNVYRWRGELAKALTLLQRIPRDGMLEGATPAYLGEVRFALGQTDPARNEWRQGLNLIDDRLKKQPNEPELLLWQAYLLDALGDTAGAAAVKVQLRDLGEGRVGQRPFVYDLRSRLLTPEELLTRVEEGVRNTTPPTSAMMFYSVASLRLDPAYDSIRNTPRFQAALRVAEADPRLNPKARP